MEGLTWLLVGVILGSLVFRARRVAHSTKVFTGALPLGGAIAMRYRAASAYRKTVATRTTGANPYSATAIVACAGACAAVEAIGDKRFLDAEGDVPSLPVRGCDAASCRCRYVHYADRRTSVKDRRNPTNSITFFDASGQHDRRRAGPGRRKSDWS
jgi:hypothetical protein